MFMKIYINIKDSKGTYIRKPDQKNKLLTSDTDLTIIEKSF